MEKEQKKRYYSITYLICVVLLLSSIPFTMFINNELISFLLSISFKIIAMVYMFIYIKKDGLPKPLFDKHKKENFLFTPLILLCFSNIIVAVISTIKITNDINYFNIISGIINALIVSILEEILFRSLLFNELLKSKKVELALLLQALIFGSVHLLNISSIASIPIILAQVFYTAFLGIILGVIYYKSRNIIYPIAYHFLFNSINDVISVNLFDISWDYKFFIINIFVGIVIFLYTIFIFKRGNLNVTTDLDL